MVYVSTVPDEPSAEYEAGGVGILWALDAKTGKKLWHFDTVPKDLWGDPRSTPAAASGTRPPSTTRATCTSAPATRRRSPARRSIPWGSSRPGPNLYADSMVKLDAKTGKLEWYYQQTPHNIYDWDFQDSPILIKVGRQGGGDRLRQVRHRRRRRR